MHNQCPLKLFYNFRKEKYVTSVSVLRNEKTCLAVRETIRHVIIKLNFNLAAFKVKSAAEFLNTSFLTTGESLLLSGIERMTVGTNFHFQFFPGGNTGESIAACALYL
jgi:hypothetical protein